MSKALLALVLLLGTAPAAADEVTAPGFIEVVAAEDRELQLCTATLFRWKRIIKAYSAALYLEDCAGTERTLDDVPKRLELVYERGFEAAQFGEAAGVVLARSFSEEVLAPLRERIARLDAAYRSVAKGDRYALTYLPGRGTELALNGLPLVVIPGADFARAYFSIWLGQRPVDRRLRDRLLGR